MKSQNVEAFASHDLPTIRWDQTIDEVALLMEKNHFSHFAITDASGTVVGAISRRDISHAKMSERPGLMAQSRIYEFMNYPALTVPFDVPLEMAAAGMLEHNVSALLVSDEAGKISGIITSDHLLAALIEILASSGPKKRLESSPIVQELVREVQSAGL
jgi:CBS domain-containing protein